MNRRQILQHSIATTASLVLARVGHAQSAAAIDFSSPLPMSGAFAAIGKYAELGVRLAIQQYGNVLNRPLAYTLLDTEGKPATGVRRVQEAAQQRGSKFFVGGFLSPEALAMGKEIDRIGGVLFAVSGADEITGKECNRATFRWPVPAFGAISQTVRPLTEMLPNAKRWYTITSQYVFGEDMLSATKAIFREKNIELAGNSYHSLTEKEFSGYLTNAIAAKPDVLLLLNFGSQSTDTLRQAVSFGMHKKMKILIPWTSGLEQFQALGPDLTDGIYLGAQYWHTVDSPVNKELVNRTTSQLKMTPNYSLAAGYIITKITIDAINKAGSTDPRAVISALEGMKYDGLTGVEEIRKADHQVIKDYYLLKGKPRNRMANADDFVDIINSGKSFLPADRTGCKLA